MGLQKFDSLATKILKLIPIGAAPKNGFYLDGSGNLGFALNGTTIFRAPSGTNGSSRLVSTGGVVPPAATSGTDTTPVITEVYLAEMLVPAGVLATGIAVLNGSAVSGNMQVMLYDPAGALVASSVSTAQAGTAAYQKVPFSAPVNLLPGTYYAAVAFDNTTSRFRSLVFGDFGSGKLTGQVYGTPPVTPTVPTTFTASLGPIASLY